MRIVVSDSSCLIDVRKASLLEVFLRLPYEFLIPNTLFEEELLKFTDEEKAILLRGGLQVVDLPGSRVEREWRLPATFRISRFTMGWPLPSPRAWRSAFC